MHKLLAVLIFCTILSLGCAPIAPVYHPDLQVTMETIGSFAPGGEHLEIDGNGNVSYERWSGPVSNKAIEEQKSAMLTPLQIAELVNAIKETNVFGMEERYAEFCFDCPTIDLAIMLDGQKKHVSHYGWDCGGPRWGSGSDVPYPPMALCRLEKMIRTTVHGDQSVSLTPTP